MATVLHSEVGISLAMASIMGCYKSMYSKVICNTCILISCLNKFLFVLGRLVTVVYRRLGGRNGGLGLFKVNS